MHSLVLKETNLRMMLLCAASVFMLSCNPIHSYASESANSVCVQTTVDLNLRSGPGANHTKLATVSANTEMVLLEEYSNGWIRVSYNNTEYYCSGKYVKRMEQNTLNYGVVRPETKTETVTVAVAETNAAAETEEIAVVREVAIPAADYSSYQNRVIGESGSSADIVTAANNYWNSNIPDWLKKKFIDQGWNVKISGIPLKNRYGYSVSIAGMTDFEAKCIFIDNRQSPIKRGTMLHEIGHFLDGSYDFPSNSDEFKRIYNKEKNNFVYSGSVGDKHETSNSMEYFASVFQDIVQNGDRIKEQIPESYEFVLRYMK